MDFNALQHKLFAMDPTDPKEDLARLQAQAQGGVVSADAPKVDLINESVEVPEGTLQMDRDYDIADFAALAGITLERKQKTGSAGQLKGKDAFTKSSKPGGNETPHPARGKLVGEEGPLDSVKQGFKNYNTPGAIDPDFKGAPGQNAPAQKQQAEPQKVKGGVTGAQLGKQLGISDPQLFNISIMKIKNGQELTRPQHMVLSEAFQKLMAMDPTQTQKVMQLLKRMEAAPAEAQQPKLKPRDPNWRDMEALRKSGAAGSHKDKKKLAKQGYAKHKSKEYESIKEMLFAKLNEKRK